MVVSFLYNLTKLITVLIFTDEHICLLLVLLSAVTDGSKTISSWNQYFFTASTAKTVVNFNIAGHVHKNTNSCIKTSSETNFTFVTSFTVASLRSEISRDPPTQSEITGSADTVHTNRRRRKVHRQPTEMCQPAVSANPNNKLTTLNDSPNVITTSLAGHLVPTHIWKRSSTCCTETIPIAPHHWKSTAPVSYQFFCRRTWQKTARIPQMDSLPWPHARSVN